MCGIHSMCVFPRKIYKIKFASFQQKKKWVIVVSTKNSIENIHEMGRTENLVLIISNCPFCFGWFGTLIPFYYQNTGRPRSLFHQQKWVQRLIQNKRWQSIHSRSQLTQNTITFSFLFGGKNPSTQTSEI